MRCWKQLGDVDDCMGVTPPLKSLMWCLAEGWDSACHVILKVSMLAGGPPVCLGQRRSGLSSFCSHWLWLSKTQLGFHWALILYGQTWNEVIVKWCLCHPHFRDCSGELNIHETDINSFLIYLLNQEIWVRPPDHFICSTEGDIEKWTDRESDLITSWVLGGVDSYPISEIQTSSGDAF